MAKNTTPSFILTLRLNTQRDQEDILNKRFNIGRMIYNACLREAYKNYKLMKESKAYIKTCKMPKGEERKKRFAELRGKYNLTITYIDDYVSPMQKKFKKNIDSHTAQKLAERALNAVNKLIYGKAKKIHFKKYNEEISLKSKTNKTGIRYRDGYIKWNGLEIPVIIKPNDEYAQLSIQSRVKYCRIFRQYVKNRYKYYVQLILEGIPPLKERKIGKGDVGLDAGTQTESIVSDNEVKLVELAPKIDSIDRENNPTAKETGKRKTCKQSRKL